MANVLAPLYRDPIFDGAADPMVIYNREEKAWQMFYTQRRANADSVGVSYCYGSAIGVAQTDDGGNSWYYRGALALDFERGHNTYWAPEIIFYEGIYHMYVTYIRGVHLRWAGKASILHYTSDNLWDWVLVAPVDLDEGGSLIDACCIQLPGGGLRMWYKNEADKSHIWAADSDDGQHWRVRGAVITDTSGEGPNVFAMGGYYWMVVDIWDGQAVYRSDDLESWIRQKENILKLPGRRPEDGTIGGHADIVEYAGRGYIFYFTHPGRTRDFWTICDEGQMHGAVPYEMRRSSVQAAELKMVDGALGCDRDGEFEMGLN